MKRYELTAEVYTEATSQDPDSGSIVRTWDYAHPEYITCKARSVRPWGSVEDFGAAYNHKEYLEVYTPNAVPLARRIGRIRNRLGDLMWTNDSGAATVFNVSGCSPSIDSNGRSVDYVVLLELFSPQPF